MESYLREHLKGWSDINVARGSCDGVDGVGQHLVHCAFSVDQGNMVSLGLPCLDQAPGREKRLKDCSALPPSLFPELLPDEVHIAARIVECGGLFDSFALDWNELQLEQGVNAVSSLDLLDGRSTWDIFAQHV